MIVRDAFPRVQTPGVDPADVEALQAAFREHEEHREHIAQQGGAMVAAMLRLGKPIARPRKRKARPTAHVRHMARMRARAAFVK